MGIFNPILLIVMAYLLVGFLINGVLLLRQRSTRLRFLGALVVLSLVLQALWIQRGTNLGLLALGGSHYWVDRAAQTESYVARRNALGMALEGTEYALNLTEQHLLNAYAEQPEIQSDLFLVLADLAPNEGWHGRYFVLSCYFASVAASL